MMENNIDQPLLNDFISSKEAWEFHVNCYHKLIKDFNETMESYRVLELMTRDIKITGGQLIHDNTHSWCIRRGEGFSNFLQAGFSVREYITMIDCLINEEPLGIVVENEPDLAQFGFTMPDVSYNENKEPGKRIMVCTLRSIEDLQKILPIISRWLKE
ncbi:MAG: hypothetical protein K0R18_429 [Bacillales bacterium]|jgi:hypothetical protein|nr:hypothetical protein [Bacillales bacterium]